MSRMSKGEKVFQVFISLFMIILAIILVYPFWDVVCHSLSDKDVVRNTTTFLWPKGFSLDAYKALVMDDGFAKSVWNSVFVVGMHTLICIFTTFMVAYPLAQEKAFKGRKVFSYYILICTKFSGGVIPTYLLMRDLGLINNLWSLILPGVTGMSFCFMQRKFIQQIPEVLREAATVDGANEWAILFKVIMPLCVPSIAYIAAMNLIAEWNSWYDCMIYILDRDKYIVMAKLREIIFVYTSEDFLRTDPDAALQGADVTAYREIMKQAATVIATIPVMCVFPFMQKQFISGLTEGGVKG